MKQISLESAERQMDELLDYYEIEKEHIVNEHGKDAIQTIYNRLVGSIQNGRLEIKQTEEGLLIIQHLKHAPGDVSSITYHEITAEAKLAMDGHGDNKGFTKMHALMGALSKLGPSAMKQLRGVDQGIMERLALVFQIV